MPEAEGLIVGSRNRQRSLAPEYLVRFRRHLQLKRTKVTNLLLRNQRSAESDIFVAAAVQCLAAYLR